MKKFEDDSRHATRALQAYLILIGLAAERRTIRYGQLASLMHFGVREDGIGRGSVLARPLGGIMHWCEREGLPALTSLVVMRRAGRPELGLTSVSPDKITEEHERVFDTDWFGIFPPTVEELEAARLEADAA